MVDGPDGGGYHAHMPARLPAEIRERLERIRCLVLDVDGVLTDGVLVYGPHGEAAKRFSVRDGLAVHLILRAGIEVAVISGRRSEAVGIRCRELGVRDELVIQGSRDKAADLDEIERILGVGDEAIAAMGDDLPDMPMLQRAGFAACPADAEPQVAVACDHVCGSVGGRGAVREVAELILKAQGRWHELTARWTGGEA